MDNELRLYRPHAPTPKVPRQFKVLFVYPNLYMMNMMPPAIGIFSALLKQKGIEVALFDTTYYMWDHGTAQVSGQGVGRFDVSSDKRKELTLQVRPFNLAERGIEPKDSDIVEDFKNLVDSFKPDLIAMSAVEDTFPQGLYLLQQIRNRGIPTVVGGVFATFAPQLAIRDDAVRMVCVGEGEGALVELCERMAMGRDYSDVLNLWVKDSFGNVRKNPQRQVVDIDTLPMLDFEIFEENRIYRPMAGKVYRMIPIETHRGCPYTCSYCNSPSQVTMHRDAGAGRFFRKKNMQKVADEIAYLTKRWNAEYIYFPADTFLAWADDEFNAFIDMYRGVKLPFWMQTRPETVTETNVGLLKEVGCHRVSVGIEHGSEAFRRDIVSRNIANADLIARTNILGRDIPVSVNNITGFPTETRELAFETIHLNRDLQVDTMNCYTFMPYHGTPLRDMAVRMGLMAPDAITCSLTAGTVLDMPQYPAAEIAGLVRCFSLYARLPMELWPTIKRAEANKPEGDALFAELRDEYIARYFNDGKVTFS